MAPAVLANRSESNWPPQPKTSVAFMGKAPFTAKKKSNPNPKFNKKHHFHHQLAQPDNIVGHVVDDPPVVTHSVASNDASSINQMINDFSSSSYVSFPISSFTRKELIDLKSQLIFELGQIRELKNRIQSNDFQARSSSTKKPLAKKNISENKRPLPLNFSKELKRFEPQENKRTSKSYLTKSCSQILREMTMAEKQKLGTGLQSLPRFGVWWKRMMLKNIKKIGEKEMRKKMGYFEIYN
ncbi:hypothetical protein HRI_000063800 [Hibiscus trionum]|uniref:Uncharacterized protein n=1 Tax=Hibiscus trionum TaxID=183268 RepID=A0A9W7GQN8_HIBTR|nr:hypothetical protein HRI_000063800 [Hibiscus trionum]